MAKRVTILDVAAEAGVSRQTVTRAMNGMERISPETRDRVLAVSERLGYRPSRFARGLVGRTKSRTLGLVVASFHNPYYTEIAGDLLAAASARGWQLMMTSPEAGHHDEILDILAREVDLVVGHLPVDQAERLGQAAGLPVVVLEEVSEAPGIHSVVVDLESGIHDAVTELRARGARRLAMIDSAYSIRGGGSYEPSPRRTWFEAAAVDSVSGIVVGDETIAGGGEAMTRLMQTHPDTDAVLVFNDLMALGAVQAAHLSALAVPEQVRVLGIDGLSIGEAVTPRLSTISIDRAALAATTMEVVEQLAQHEFARIPAISKTISTKLLWRESA